jgi:hypothetical protein
MKSWDFVDMGAIVCKSGRVTAVPSPPRGLRRLVILGAVFLGACATPRVEYVPYEVEVEVQRPCTVEQPAKPRWKSEDLRKSDDVDHKVKVLLAERQQHLGYEEKLEAALQSCR